MAGTVIADRLEAASTSQLVIENGVALTPPTIADVNGVAIGTFCRAWVNFNGSGTVAIRASFNVSSITDNGVGNYTLNFTTAMPDADYCLAQFCRSDFTNASTIASANPSASKTASVINILTKRTNDATTLNDMSEVDIVIFR